MNSSVISKRRDLSLFPSVLTENELVQALRRLLLSPVTYYAYGGYGDFCVRY